MHSIPSSSMHMRICTRHSHSSCVSRARETQQRCLFSCRLPHPSAVVHTPQDHTLSHPNTQIRSQARHSRHSRARGRVSPSTHGNSPSPAASAPHDVSPSRRGNGSYLAAEHPPPWRRSASLLLQTTRLSPYRTHPPFIDIDDPSWPRPGRDFDSL